MSVLSTRLSAAVSLALLLSCAAPDNDPAQTGGPAAAGKASVPEPATGGTGNDEPHGNAGTPVSGGACREGADCACEDGATGKMSCQGGTGSCRCETCPVFAPQASSIHFEPCGGNPEGNWRMRSYDVSEMRVYVTDILDPSRKTSCAARVRVDTAGYLSMRLDSDGSAIVSYRRPQVSMLVDEACIANNLGVGCAQVLDCRAAGCNTCACDPAPRSPTLSTDATYTHDDSSIQIEGSTFEFCARDGVLRVRDVADHVKYELELEQDLEPHCTGTPAPCSINKFEKDCKLVAGCEAQGSCSGDAKPQCPDLLGSDACVAAGCRWSFIGCGGEPVGPCESLSVEWCRFTPGCRVEN